MKTSISHKTLVSREWCVEFWDFGAWNELASTRCKYKAQAITLAQKMNRETSHEIRTQVYEGHRFRVRKVQEEVA